MEAGPVLGRMPVVPLLASCVEMVGGGTMGFWDWVEERLRADGRVSMGEVWSKAWAVGCGPFDLGWVLSAWGVVVEWDRACNRTDLVASEGWTRRGGRGWNPLAASAVGLDRASLVRGGERSEAPVGVGTPEEFWGWMAGRLSQGFALPLAWLIQAAWVLGEDPFAMGWQLGVWATRPVAERGVTYLWCPPAEDGHGRVRRWRTGMERGPGRAAPWNAGGDPAECGGVHPVYGTPIGCGSGWTGSP
jgi:hypothetical protein